MLHPVSADVRQVLCHMLRLNSAILSSRLKICTGCQRHLATVSPLKPRQCNQYKQACLALVLSTPLPAKGQGFSTTTNHSLWRPGLFAMSADSSGKDAASDGSSKDKDPPEKSGDASKSSKTSDAVSKTAPSSSGISGAADQPTETVKVEKMLKVTPKARKVKPIDYTYTGNTYILPVRAMNEFLLKPVDLEGLPKYQRRSPYDSGPKITVYLRSDVEVVAKKVWGNLDNIKKEKAKFSRLDGQRNRKYDLFQIRAMLDAHQRMATVEATSDVGDEKPYVMGELPKQPSEQERFLKDGSARVVMSAVLVNSLNSVLKLIAWLYTGSHSMFSEFIHSVADTMNQIILGIGLYHSIKKPDPDHPYGYSNLRNISSLISGVGIFFLGTGLSLYHGVQGFLHPVPITSLHWGIATLVGALFSEGATLIIAINQVKRSSKAMGIEFWQYVRQGVDPNVTVVLLEDMAAVLGVGIAGACMGVAQIYGSSYPDAIGSFLIGGLLGVVASFIISTNISALVGKSIPFPVRQGISHVLEGDRMIRSLHDVKAVNMGGSIRFKAEVDFDGREITRAYLYKQDLDQLLMEMKQLQTVEDVEAFMLTHGERIVDSLGEEVDRIEKILKKQYPELRHVDLEAL